MAGGVPQIAVRSSCPGETACRGAEFQFRELTGIKGKGETA